MLLLNLWAGCWLQTRCWLACLLPSSLAGDFLWKWFCLCARTEKESEKERNVKSGTQLHHHHWLQHFSFSCTRTVQLVVQRERVWSTCTRIAIKELPSFLISILLLPPPLLQDSWVFSSISLQELLHNFFPSVLISFSCTWFFVLRILIVLIYHYFRFKLLVVVVVVVVVVAAVDNGCWDRIGVLAFVSHCNWEFLQWCAFFGLMKKNSRERVLLSFAVALSLSVGTVFDVFSLSKNDDFSITTFVVFCAHIKCCLGKRLNLI